MADIDDEEEIIHFQKIVGAFRGYRYASTLRVKEKLKYLKTLPAEQQTCLQNYKKHLEEQIVCIEHNGEIIKLILEDVEKMFDNAERETTKDKPDTVSGADLDKIHSTFRQLVRDWSSRGQEERDLCYKPIIDTIKELYPTKTCGEEIEILVPGAGLGRLAYEIAKLGYTCQGNEFSLFMLFTSNYILNRCNGANSLTIYPWVHSGSNLINTDDQVAPVLLPDTNPSSISSDLHFTMAAGDFLEIYNEDDSWTCVATCFFIDCAKNIVEFIEAIYKILKPGGHWINLGPLLYHFADQQGHDSIEPSWDIVRDIIKTKGFTFVKEPKFMKTVYTQNPNSLLKTEFKSIFFVAKKTSEKI